MADLSWVDALLHCVRNHERYEGVSDVFDLAALYCVAIERGHVFTDGNKRTAINCTYAFLKQNGVQTHLPTDLEAMVLRVAMGEVSAPDFGAYLRRTFAKPGA